MFDSEFRLITFGTIIAKYISGMVNQGEYTTTKLMTSWSMLDKWYLQSKSVSINQSINHPIHHFWT